MGCADQGLIRSSGFFSLDFSRLLPVRRQQPITPSRYFPRKRHKGRRARPMPGLPADSSAPWPSPPRRCAPSCWPEPRRPRGSSGQQTLDPRIGPGCLRAQQDGLGSDDQQLTDVLVAEPADPAQPRLATGGSRPRHEAKPGRELPPTTEGVGVRHGGGDGGGDQRPDAWDGGQPPADRVGPVPSHDPSIDLAIRCLTSSS